MHLDHLARRLTTQQKKVFGDILDGMEITASKLEHALEELHDHWVRKSARDRAADFFNALRGSGADYDRAILTFEKLVAEYAPSATGQHILEIMGRAYSSARARGSLGALMNRDGELWKKGER
jgi:hypothetical protein